MRCFSYHFLSRKGGDKDIDQGKVVNHKGKVKSMKDDRCGYPWSWLLYIFSK
jgi:hypothetical protein